METKKFNAFDKVIIKSQIDECWSCDLYSHLDKDTGMHETINRCGLKDEDILPYEGNEELVGKTDSPEEEVRLEEGEWIICFGNMSDVEEDDDYCLAKFIRVQEAKIYASNKIKWDYAIRFKDFDPSNMEETRKHILEVRNGKIVKYRQ